METVNNGKATITPEKQVLPSYDVHELQIGDNMTIHGKLLELSPIKTSRKKENCKCFMGKLSDGLQTTRFVSFEAHLRNKMDKLREEDSSVSLSNYHVQENKYEPGTLEILTSKNSTVSPSPKNSILMTHLKIIVTP